MKTNIKYWGKDERANGPSCHLIAEWVEPKPIKGWVNVYRYETGSLYGMGLYDAKSEAERCRSHRTDCIACIEVDCPEGEGLK